MNGRIAELIRLRLLEEENAPDAEIVGLWANALEDFADARNDTHGPRSRVKDGYDSARIAALAVVRTANLRVTARNHHEVTISTAQLLLPGEAAESLQDLQANRTLRSDLEYRWERRATREDAQALVQTALTILAAAAKYIRASRPGLAAAIGDPTS